MNTTLIRRRAAAVLGTALTATAVANTATPYDAYLRPVRQTLAALPAQPASFAQAAALTREGHRFRYRRTHPYIPREPAEVERSGYGDCKDKALWLAARLGDGSVRFVIGKAYAHSRENHAWLEWQSGGVTWILDPALHSAPRDRRTTPDSRYIALYSYGKAGARRL